MAENHALPPSNKNPPSLQSLGSNTNNARSPSTSSTGLMRTPSSPSMGHRASFAENLRSNPASPRQSHRQPSLSQAAVQELLNNPPVGKHEGEEFAGRDWKSIRVGEIVGLEQVKFVEMNTTVEDATNVSPCGAHLSRQTTDRDCARFSLQLAHQMSSYSETLLTPKSQSAPSTTAT
jgi:hypothetical protein